MKIGSYQISERTSPLRQTSNKRNGGVGHKKQGQGDITVSPIIEMVHGGGSTKRKRRNQSQLTAKPQESKVQKILEEIPSPFNNGRHLLSINNSLYIDRNNPNGPYHNGMLTASLDSNANQSQRVLIQGSGGTSLNRLE